MHFCVRCGVRVEDPTRPDCPHCGAPRDTVGPAGAEDRGAHVRIGGALLPRWLPWTLAAVLAGGGVVLGVSVAHQDDTTVAGGFPTVPLLPGEDYGGSGDTPSPSTDGYGTADAYSGDDYSSDDSGGTGGYETPTPEDTETTDDTSDTEDTEETRGASTVVTDYYDYLNAGNYSEAWDMGGSRLFNGSYSDWVAGFATTAHVDVTTSDDGSGSGSGYVAVNLRAQQTDGTVQTFTGTYTVQDGQITGADIQQVS